MAAKFRVLEKREITKLREAGHVIDDNGALHRTKLDLPLVGRGKVRDTYEISQDRLLIVTTDRISAFDVVLPNGIPGKGHVLNQLSLHWFGLTAQITPNHLISSEMSGMFQNNPPLLNMLQGRSVIVAKANPLKFEFVVRGYLAGSGLKDYNKTGCVCGIELPKGLVNSSRLPRPILTPSTKADTGHDENVTFETMAESIGNGLASQLRDKTIEVYKFVAEHALQRGIIIADTKLEWGIVDGQPILIDEVLTPDSSRFWPADRYEEGKSQDSFDKQYVRDYLELLTKEGKWNKAPPGPILPEDIVQNTTRKYREALEKLTRG